MSCFAYYVQRGCKRVLEEAKALCISELFHVLLPVTGHCSSEARGRGGGHGSGWRHRTLCSAGVCALQLPLLYFSAKRCRKFEALLIDCSHESVAVRCHRLPWQRVHTSSIAVCGGASKVSALLGLEHDPLPLHVTLCALPQVALAAGAHVIAVCGGAPKVAALQGLKHEPGQLRVVDRLKEVCGNTVSCVLLCRFVLCGLALALWRPGWSCLKGDER